MRRLSIVIVTYRSWACLDRCLESLVSGAHATAFDVVVVDNDARDDEIEAFRSRYPSVSFVANPGNLGFAHGCNVGARHAAGELLLFLNPDVRVGEGQLDALVDAYDAEPEVRIMTAVQRDGRGRLQKAFDAFPTPWSSLPGVRALARTLRPARFPHPRRDHRELVRCDWVTGAVLLIDREAFEAIDGWSEAFWMYHEDVDLCRRARDRGWSVACTPRAVFVHDHGGATRVDEATEVRTRAETTISRHVYVARHHRGAGAALFHGLVAARRLTAATVVAVADLLTLRRIRRLRVRGAVWRVLVAYYAGRDGSAGWISPRAPQHPRRREGEVRRSATCT